MTDTDTETASHDLTHALDLLTEIREFFSAEEPRDRPHPYDETGAFDDLLWRIGDFLDNNEDGAS